MMTFFSYSDAISGRFVPHLQTSDGSQAHSSLWPHVQKPPAYHPQVGQFEQRYQADRVLGQPLILGPYTDKLPLDDPKRVFHLGPHTGLHLLQFLPVGTHVRASVQCFAFDRHPRDVPIRLGVLGLNFFAFLNTPEARVGKDIGFLAVQQGVALGDVIRFGRRGRYAVHQPRIGIDAGVRLHAEVPWIAFLGLVYLRVTLTVLILAGTGCRNHGGIHDRALLEQQALGRQGGVDGGQELNAQVVSFKQVSKPQDSALVRQVVFALIESCKLAKQQGIVQRFFHGWVRQVEPLLKEVGAQHGSHSKRRSPALGATRQCVRGNQRHQLGPRHRQFHHVQELTLALGLETGCGWRPGSSVSWIQSCAARGEWEILRSITL